MRLSNRTTYGDRRLLVLLLVALISAGLAIAARSAGASQFRFGHVSWERTQPGGREIRFTVTQGWGGRDDRRLPLQFGDGSVGAAPAAPNTIARGTDAAGEPYVIDRYEVTHTYDGDGPYLAELSSCCRTPAARNSPNSPLKVEALVDLRDGTNGASPVAFSPHVLRVPPAGLQMQRLRIADPDGRGFKCRLASSSESEILEPAGAPSSPVVVSPTCAIGLPATGLRPGEQFAVQVIIESDDGPLADTTRVALDMMIEVAEGVLSETGGPFGSGPAVRPALDPSR